VCIRRRKLTARHDIMHWGTSCVWDGHVCVSLLVCAIEHYDVNRQCKVATRCFNHDELRCLYFRFLSLFVLIMLGRVSSNQSLVRESLGYCGCCVPLGMGEGSSVALFNSWYNIASRYLLHPGGGCCSLGMVYERVGRSGNKICGMERHLLPMVKKGKVQR
jgi:hypothetical protein